MFDIRLVMCYHIFMLHKMNECILARYDNNDKDRKQTLQEHLQNVSDICVDFMINYPTIAELLGLSHDLGKACQAFQRRLEGSTEKVNHSFASSVYLLNKYINIFNDIKNESDTNKQEEISAILIIIQICAFITSCHHRGLVDIVKYEDSELDLILKKLEDDTFKSNYEEVLNNSKDLCLELDKLIESELFKSESIKLIKNIHTKYNQSYKDTCFYLGMYLRYFYSCLIDADRIDSYNFENKLTYKKNQDKKEVIIENFKLIASTLDNKINSYPRNDLNNIRKEIYEDCIKNANQGCNNVYNLNVQTGGGKTFSSFRFAIERLLNKKLDRIIYVVPYISIIEQNAQIIRDLLKDLKLEDMLVESHSNAVKFDNNNDEYHLNKNEYLFTSWNEPIIFTTMVSFLESVYGNSTQNNRRFHNLGNSVIIFDEIQSLPINCIGLFNLLVKFLTQELNTTVVLCTATQPALDRLSIYDKNDENIKFIELPKSTNLIDKQYPLLRRTEVIRQDNTILNKQQFIDFALEKLQGNNNLLIVVNTKKCARETFSELKNFVKCYHLSTNMCPQHRLDVIDEVKKCLANKDKFVLVSTQLIEAGVDLDFECAIRSQSGLESIIQTAGRCNREGKLTNEDGSKRLGQVYVVRLSKDLENLDSLPDIAYRQNKFVGVCATTDIDINSNAVIKKYFEQLYGSESRLKMQYKIKGEQSTAVDLLVGANENIKSDYFTLLKYQFGTVADNFSVINNGATQIGVLVNYKEGSEYIGKLRWGKIDARKCQRFMVNVFENNLSAYNCRNQDSVIYSMSYDGDLGLVPADSFDYIF